MKITINFNQDITAKLGITVGIILAIIFIPMFLSKFMILIEPAFAQTPGLFGKWLLGILFLLLVICVGMGVAMVGYLIYLLYELVSNQYDKKKKKI